MSKWRVFWVPKPAPIAPPRVPVLAGWTDLAEREASTGIRPGDPILLAPDCRVDELTADPRTAADPLANDQDWHLLLWMQAGEQTMASHADAIDDDHADGRGAELRTGTLGGGLTAPGPSTGTARTARYRNAEIGRAHV